VKDLKAKILDVATKQREALFPYVRLVEVTLPNYECIRLANTSAQVQFEFDTDGVTPHVWHPFPMAFEDFSETKRGDLPQLQIGVSNVTLELAARLDEAEGLTDQTVRILIVNTTDLSNSDYKLEWKGEVAKCEVDQQTALFTLGHPRLNAAVFPARRVLTQGGVTRFGNAECGYVIPDSPGESIGTGFSKCPLRSLDNCRERGDDEVARGLERMHPRRFCGMPGVSEGNP
jgi:phage-related protein